LKFTRIVVRFWIQTKMKVFNLTISILSVELSIIKYVISYLNWTRLYILSKLNETIKILSKYLKILDHTHKQATFQLIVIYHLIWWDISIAYIYSHHELSLKGWRNIKVYDKATHKSSNATFENITTSCRTQRTKSCHQYCT